MTQMLFNKTNCALQTLQADIEMRRMGLPDVEWPLTWTDAKIRELFDWMFRGYLVAYGASVAPAEYV